MPKLRIKKAPDGETKRMMVLANNCLNSNFYR